MFYTVINDGDFYFAQDPLLLKQVKEFEPDYVGISEYLSFDHCLEDRTFFQGVNYILPAQKLVVNKNGIKKEIYWSLPSCDGKKSNQKRSI